MEQNELNKVALELAIKSLDNKKSESKNIVVIPPQLQFHKLL